MRLSRLYAEQERALAHYIRREVYPHSAYYRRVIDAAGLGAGFITTRDDLRRLPLTTPAEAASHLRSLVLIPTADRVIREGDRSLALRLAWARLIGKAEEGRSTLVEPLFKPVQWMADGDLRIGWTASDLDGLAELGRRWLEHAGLRRTDILVSVLPVDAHLAFWQLQLGARRGGVGTVVLGNGVDGALVRSWRPTALAGWPDDLERLLEDIASAGGDLPGLRTVLAVGEPLDDEPRRRLADLAAIVSGLEPPAIVAAWAPSGARALWTECRDGIGFHTWPHAEVVEVVDGELVWSSIGWRGTVVLRMTSGVHGKVDEAPCPACGRSTPRVVVSPGEGTGR